MVDSAIQRVVLQLEDVGTSGVVSNVYELAGAEKAAEKATEAMSRAGRAQAMVQRTMKSQIGATKRELPGYIAGLKGAETQTDSLARSTTKAAITQRSLAEALDETSFSFGSISLNVGSFTVALKDMATQIPILVTLLGSLVSVIGAFGTVAITSGVAGAAALGGGLAALANSVEQSMSDVEGTGEAMLKIFEGFRGMLERAFEPLINDTTMGLAVNFLEQIAESANAAAATFENMLFMGEDSGIVPLFRDLGDVLANRIPAVVNSAATAMVRMHDIFIGAIDAVLAGLPDLISFFTDITLKIHEAGSGFLDTIGEFITEMVRFGTTVLNAVLPVLNAFGGLLTGVLQTLNDVNPAMVEFAVQIIAAFGALRILSGKLGSVTTGMQFLADSIRSTFFAASSLTGIFRDVTGAASRLAIRAVPGLSKMGLAALNAANKMGILSGTTQEAMNAITSSIDSPKGALSGFGDAISKAARGQLSEVDGITSEVNLFRGLKRSAISAKRSVVSAFSRMATSASTLPVIGRMTNIATMSITDFGSAVSNAAGQLMFLERTSGVIGSRLVVPPAVSKSFTALRTHLTTAYSDMLAFAYAVRTGDKSLRSFAYSMTIAPIKKYGSALLKTIPFINAATLYNYKMVFSLSRVSTVATFASGSLSTYAATNMAAAKNADTLSKTIYFVAEALKAKAYAAWKSITSITVETAVNKLLNLTLKKLLWTYPKEIAVKLASAAASLVAAAAAVVLQLSLGGVLAIATALIVGLALLGGMFVAMGGDIDGLRAKFDTFMAKLKEFAKFYIKTTKPIFNGFMNLLDGIYASIGGLIGGLTRIGKALGIVSDGAGKGSSSMGALKAITVAITKPFNLLATIVGDLGKAIGGILGTSFEVLGASVSIVIGLFKLLFAVLGDILGIIPGFDKFAAILGKIGKGLVKLPQSIGKIIDWTMGKVEGIVNTAIPLLNDMLRAADKIPHVDVDTIEPADLTGDKAITDEDVDEAFESDDKSKDDESPFENPDFNANLTMQQNNEVSGTFNMAPEEEERVKRLVEDAMKEANKFRRRRTSVQ